MVARRAPTRQSLTARPGAVDRAPRQGGAEVLGGAIRDRLPGVRLLTEPLEREAYRNDETAGLRTELPGLVALPTSTQEVAELVRLAAAHEVPVVPRGAGSGLSGGATGIEGGLTIDDTAYALQLPPARRLMAQCNTVTNDTAVSATQRHAHSLQAIP